MEQLQCISCKKKITNDKGCVKFKCPKCGEYEIIRCKHCREVSIRYRCPNCGFEGPN